MNYREVLPAPPLRRFLECFWFLTEGDASGAPAEPVLPDGCTELIVHFGDPFHRVTAAGDFEAQPRAFFVGEMTRPLVAGPSGRVGTMGIRFRPGGAFPLAEGWASAAADCGYFDQAHLVRDVRDFAGVPPSHLLQSASDFSKHFVSEARLAALFDDGYFQDSRRATAQIGVEGEIS